MPAAAASLCAAAVGTETDGSITGPSAVENIFGLKPTLGTHLAGRNRSDQSSTGHRWSDGAERDRRRDSARHHANAVRRRCRAAAAEVITRNFCNAVRCNGKRIGRDVRFFDYNYFGSGIPGDEESVAFAQSRVADVMHSLGATIVDTDTGDVFAYTGRRVHRVAVRVQSANRAIFANVSATPTFAHAGGLDRVRQFTLRPGARLLRPGSLRSCRNDER